MRLKIYLEGNELDLFQDEVIELNSSIANTDDVTKINSDYTKSFTVPASENNNRVFKHYYQADIDNTFDSRTKKDGYITYDGVVFRIGSIRLEKVIVKKNRASSYTLVFWGKLVNLKTLFKDDLLSSLPLSQYDFEYSDANFQTGLGSYVPGTDENIIFSLFENKRQYTFNPATNDNTDKLVNIAFNGNPRGLVYQNMHPSIRLNALIQAIEEKYDLVFTQDFFVRPEFNNLWMVLNGTDSKNIFSSQTFTKNILWDGFEPNLFPAESGDAFTTINFSLSFVGLPNIIVRTYKNNVLINESFGNIDTQAYDFIQGDFFRIEIVLLNDISINAVAVITGYQVGLNPILVPYVVQQEDFLNGILEVGDPVLKTTSVIPNIKVTDFLKGIFQMFKLVAIPVENNIVYINNVDDYYKEGKLIDITKYVDFEKYDVSRGDVFNEIDFKYQTPQTILNKRFLENTGEAYSDDFVRLNDENGIPLDGEKLSITLPFEQPIYERIAGNIQYALLTNDKIEKTGTKPIIHYNNVVGLNGVQLSIMQGASAISYTGNLNIPSQCLGLDNPSTSLNWGEEFSTWNRNIITNTLFSKYWQSYILSVFNIKKRLFKFDAILPSFVLLNLKLNDILFIKERYYRINDFTINLNTRQTSLNLTNVFDPNFGLFAPSQTEVYLSGSAQTFKVYVSNGAIMNIVLQDLGVGTSWLTAVKNGNFIDITVTQNEALFFRDLFINVDNGAGQIFQIYVNQSNAF